MNAFDKMFEKLLGSRYRNHIFLALILAFALALRLLFFTGIGASDSLAYAELSYNFGNPEKISHGDLFLSSRIGLFFPVNLLYGIFGVNEFSSNILVLLISLASIVLIYKFGKLLFNEKAGLLSALLMSFFPMDVVFSTRLLSDIPSAFFAALSVYFFLRSEKIKRKAKSGFYCLFSGLALGAAYLIREMSLLMGLFFIVYVVYKRKIRMEYFFMALGFVLMLSLEFLYFLSLTGNPFFRYMSISTEINTIVETDNYGRGSLPFSLFHYPYIIFTDSLLGLFYPFIFIAMAYFIMRKKRETYSMLFWFVPVLLYLSFGSESFARYVPIPVAARFLFIISIPGILLLSYFLSQDEEIIRKILMPSIIALLFLTSIGYIYASEHRFAINNEKSSYNYLQSLPEKTIYTDSRTASIFDYLSGFKGGENIKSFNYYKFLDPESTYALDLSQKKDSYVVINWNLINFFVSSKKGIVFPEEIYDIPQSWVLEKEFKGRGQEKIQIYYSP